MQAARSTARSVTASCIVASELASKMALPSASVAPPSSVGMVTGLEHAKSDPTPSHGAYATARFNMDDRYGTFAPKDRRDCNRAPHR